MDAENRKQIQRLKEVQKGAQRLRCMEHLGRTHWRSYGHIPETRTRKPLQMDPATEDVLWLRAKVDQSSTPGEMLPTLHEPGSRLLGRNLVSLSTRAPIGPARGMSATAELLKKFGYLQQDPRIGFDPHRTDMGQRCKYTQAIKIPTNNQNINFKINRKCGVDFPSLKEAGLIEKSVSNTTQNQVCKPLSKVRTFPTVSNLSSNNGVLKIICTKSKRRRNIPHFLTSFDFELRTPSYNSRQANELNSQSYGVHCGIQKERTEIVIQKAEKLLSSPLRAQASSSVGSTDTQRTISEDPDTTEVDRILLHEPHLNRQYPDEIENPDGKLTIWPRGSSSSLNTADSVETKKLPDLLDDLPKTHVNLKHKVQDWINNHLQCSYSFESKS